MSKYWKIKLEDFFTLNSDKKLSVGSSSWPFIYIFHKTNNLVILQSEDLDVQQYSAASNQSEIISAGKRRTWKIENE